jgi:GNAT superfamily N-acetyltransferase
MCPVTVDDYWEKFFGLPASALIATGFCVVPHVGLEGYAGAWVFRRGRATLVSVPADMLRGVELRARSHPNFADHEEWSRVFERPITRVIGPAYDGFVPAEKSVTSLLFAERLKPEHHRLLDGLKAACSEEEWDHGGIDPASKEPMFGCIVDGRLVGISQNEARTADAVSPGVATARDWRRRGVARAVLAAAIRDAFATRRLVLYQTLNSNHASVRLGESLGVIPYAQHCAYRFTTV